MQKVAMKHQELLSGKGAFSRPGSPAARTISHVPTGVLGDQRVARLQPDDELSRLCGVFPVAGLAARTGTAVRAADGQGDKK